MSDDFDVAILGGGVAGLAAARALSARDLRLVLVEGRDRLGGRILTREIDGLPLPIELGAEFIHGDAAETFAIADAASLLVDELPDDHLWLRGDRFVRIPDFWGDMLRVRRRIRGPRDRSFAAFLDATRSIPPRLRRMSREFVSGYHAADPARISALSLAAGDEEIEGPGQNRQYRIVSGYGSLVTALRSAIGEACEIRLSTIARRIVWRKGHVVIHCRSTMGGDPVEIRARAVVLAIPAAVLKAGPEAPAGIAFDPPLRRLEDDLAQLEAGHVLKLVFAFRERFWDDLEWVRKRVRGEPRLPVHFLHFPGEAVPTWWTSAPARTALLTGWAGGPGAWELSAGGEAAAIDRALAILARGLRMPRRQLEGLLDRVHHHDWSADPFSLGAYTYVGVGGLPAQKRLSRPIEGTIFVAGEAASVEETGTASGAIAAGKRAARAAMASTK